MTKQTKPRSQAFYASRGRRPGQFHHVIHRTTVESRHTSQQPSDIWDRSCILC